MEADSAVEASSGDRSDVEVMLDAVLDRGIVKLDPAGRISRWNAGARSMFGYPDTGSWAGRCRYFTPIPTRPTGWRTRS